MNLKLHGIRYYLGVEKVMHRDGYVILIINNKSKKKSTIFK